MEKKNRGLIIIVVLLVICLLLLGSYILYDKVIKKEEKSISSTNNSEVNKEDKQDKEVELTDVYIKNDIDEKVNIILSGGSKSKYDEIIDVASSVVLDNEFRNANISDDYKLSIALEYNSNMGNFKALQLSDAENIMSNSNYSEFKNASELLNSYGDSLKVISAQNIEKTYNELFIGKIKNNSVGGLPCPWFDYIEKNNTYVANHNCGDTSNMSYIFYKDSYTMKEDKVYVNLYVGTTISVYNNTTQSYSDNNIYKDLESTDNSDGNKNANYLYTVDDDNIDKSLKENYQKFAKYRMIFEKDDDSLYKFKNIEKVE